MLPLEGIPLPIAAIPREYEQWHGHPMDSVSPPGARITRFISGKQYRLNVTIGRASQPFYEARQM